MGSGEVCWGKTRVRANNPQVLHFFLKAPLLGRPGIALALVCPPEEQHK